MVLGGRGGETRGPAYAADMMGSETTRGTAEMLLRVLPHVESI